MHSSMDLAPIPVLYLLTTLLALGAVEAGRWLGSRRKTEGAEPGDAVGASVGATLGLLAFVLAFTFGMAASRYDTRKLMVVEEANAIGTTYLRTSLLPEPAASQLRAHLKEYVDLRVDLAVHPERMTDMLSRSEQLQGELWKAAAELGVQQPTVMTSLFIQALNQMIDVHGERLAAVRNRIPGVIWIFMFLTTVIGMMAIGYQAGLSGLRRRAAILCLAFAFAGVIALIADLDRPQEGLLRVSQQSMLDLQRSIR